MQFRWHMVVLLVLGYLVGYYFRGLGNATIGKVYQAAA